MADGGDDGNGRGGNGAGERFIVEAPEVFDGAAAAGENDEVGPGIFSEPGEAGGELFSAARALHEGGIDADVQPGAAAREDVEHVLNDGAGGRRDDADVAGKTGEGALAGRLEEALGGKALFEFFKGLLERAGAEGLGGLDEELIGAAGLIDVDRTTGLDEEAVAQRDAEEAGALAIHDAGQDGVFFFEVEVEVAARGGLKAGDFAGDGEVGEVFAQGAADATGELTDGEFFGLPGLPVEAGLFHSHDLSGRYDRRSSMTTTTRQVPLLDLVAQHATIREEVMAELIPLIDSQRFIMGPAVGELECAVAGYTQSRYAIGCASGSDALLLAWMALELGPGDKVVTTPYSFFATAGSLARIGIEPVFVDSDPVTYNLDPNQVEDVMRRERNVWAIQPVHLFGGAADMDPLLEIAQRHGAVVVEDAAQAIGAEYKGRRVGAIGAMGCFSFYPGKNLGGYGDSGMVTTNDTELADVLGRARLHGGRTKYVHDFVGINSRIDTLQAAVLKVKMRHLDAWTEARQRNAARYTQLFGEMQTPVGLPVVTEYQTRHVFNQYTIRCERRDELKAYLSAQGIGTEIYYPLPLHRQECFAELSYEKGDLPESEKLAGEALSLPVYPELQDEDLVYVASQVTAFYAK